MSVRIWFEKFDTAYEAVAVQDVYAALNAESRTFYVLAGFRVGTCQVDMLVLTEDSIFLAELKSGRKPVEILPNAMYYLGTSEPVSNSPVDQLITQYHEVRKWLWANARSFLSPNIASQTQEERDWVDIKKFLAFYPKRHPQSQARLSDTRLEPYLGLVGGFDEFLKVLTDDLWKCHGKFRFDASSVERLATALGLRERSVEETKPPKIHGNWKKLLLALLAGSCVVAGVVLAVILRPVSRPPFSLGDIPDQTRYSGEAFSKVDLGSYAPPDAGGMEWIAIANDVLRVSIDAQNQATISPVSADWYGTSTVLFKLNGPRGGIGSDPALFTVLGPVVDYREAGRPEWRGREVFVRMKVERSKRYPDSGEWLFSPSSSLDRPYDFAVQVNPPPERSSLAGFEGKWVYVGPGRIGKTESEKLPMIAVDAKEIDTKIRAH